MKKTLFVMLVAALVLVSAASCGGDENSKKNPPKDTLAPAESGIPAESDDESTLTPGVNDTTAAETEKPIEVNPTFDDVSLTAVVFVKGHGTIRNNPDLSTESAIAWPEEGTELTVTGESIDWYRLSYNDGVAYISKSIAGDVAVINAFTEVEDEQITLTGNVHVRSYPYVGKYSERGTLNAGTTVTRVAVSENWSRILFTETVEAESGDPVEVVKEYYITNDYIKTAETNAETSAETAGETSAATEATTEATTDASTEAFKE